MNLSEFLEKIELIDQQLAKERVSTHIRPLKAFHLMAPGYEGPLLGYGVTPEQFPDFVGPNLLRHVQHWYKQRYGERVYMPTDRGKIPVILRREVYLIRIPLVYGKPQISFQSILPLIEGISESMVKSFTTAEFEKIWKSFLDGYALIYELEDLFSYLDTKGPSFVGMGAMALLQSALEDRETGTRCLSGQLDTNGACFHSQQHAEKMLKAYLLSKGLYSEKDLSRSPFGHNLTRIHQACVDTTPEFVKVKVDVETLSQFTMNIRYTTPKVLPETAANAYWAAIRIAGLCACSLSGQERRYKG
jgi:HEPN domain-containing protein